MVTVIDYGLGNLFSVKKAFEMIGADVEVSADPASLQYADHIVLPGVGAFGDGMQYLQQSKLADALAEAVLEHRVPFLGICLGMQLLATTGFELGEHQGFGWIPGTVKKLDVETYDFKVPHIGWNNLEHTQKHPLFNGIRSDADFYFVHSYQFCCDDDRHSVATTEYGHTFTAAVAKGNIAAVQFHPEKSQEHGLKLLENFLSWTP